MNFTYFSYLTFNAYFYCCFMFLLSLCLLCYWCGTRMIRISSMSMDPNATMDYAIVCQDIWFPRLDDG